MTYQEAHLCTRQMCSGCNKCSFFFFFLLGSNNSVKKVTKKREEKLLPPPLSPLLDETAPRRNDSGSFSQENNLANPLQASSCSKHRKNENKASSNPKGICVSNPESYSKETESKFWHKAPPGGD